MLAIDTSVALPLLVLTHEAHPAVVAWWGGRDLLLSGHALLETYSVLTRLPGDLRVAPHDASRLLRERFGAPLLLDQDTIRRLPDLLAARGIAGDAVYDAEIALAAVEHRVELATRDLRARATYETFGARVVVAT